MPEQFNDVPSAAAKNKDVTAQGTLLQRCLHHGTEPGEAPPHVRHSCRDPDLRVGRNHPRRLSNTARITAGSALPTTLTYAWPGNSICTAAEDAVGAVAPSSCVGSSWTTTGNRRKSLIAAVSGAWSKSPA